jgi:hypothetical protein
MTVVVPGIPLVMIRGILAHPWSDRLVARMKKSFTQEVNLAGRVDERGGAELHVIVPVVFFVEVGRHSRRGLTYSFVKPAKPLSRNSTVLQRPRERGIGFREHD